MLAATLPLPGENLTVTSIDPFGAMVPLGGVTSEKLLLLDVILDIARGEVPLFDMVNDCTANVYVDTRPKLSDVGATVMYGSLLVTVMDTDAVPVFPAALVTCAVIVWMPGERVSVTDAPLPIGPSTDDDQAIEPLRLP